ncbi:MAG: PEGA domain-containing protein [Oligosphaeraceae bacterium]
MQLRILKGEEPGRILHLPDADEDSFTIGRGSDNDFVIKQAGVSRRHCKIYHDVYDDKWVVEDCASVNGVQVNGRRIDIQKTLHEGDEITVYDHVFKLEPDGAEAPAPALAAPPPAEEPPPFPPADADAIATPPPPPVTILEDRPAAGPAPEPLPHLTPTADLGKQVDAYGREIEAPSRFSLDTLANIAKYGLIGLIVLVLSLIAFLALKPKRAIPPSPEEAYAMTVPATMAEPAPAPATPAPGSARGEELLSEQAVEAVPVVQPETRPETTTETSPETRPATADTQPEAKAAAAADNQEDEPQSIIIATEPAGADVLLEGVHSGVTPVLLRDLKPDKSYSLELAKAGYERQMLLLQLPGELPKEPLRLVLKADALQVTSEPSGALVRLGRIVLGTTPLVAQNIRPGEHELTFELLGYETRQVTFVKEQAKGARVETTLTKQLGALEIATTPAGCEVYLDGQLVGITEEGDDTLVSAPLFVGNLLPGNATVKVVHPATGQFDNSAVTIPQNATLKRRAFIWIPTHKAILKDGRTIAGMMLRQENGEFELLTTDNRRERFIRLEPLSGELERGTYVYRELVELTPEDRDLILRNRAGRQPSEQMSTKSKLSLTVEDFLERARYVSFRGYVRETLCLTGEVTSRLRTPRGTWIQFGKHIRCLLSPNAPEEDYKKIGELSRQRQLVSIRGVYEGPDKENVYVFSNCVLLPYPD